MLLMTFAQMSNRDHIFAPVLMPQSAPAPLAARQSWKARRISWALLWISILAYKPT